MLRVGGDTGRDGVWAPDPLKLRFHFLVVEAGIVAAVAADEFKRVGVPAFWPTFNNAGGLAPQDHRPVTTGRSPRLHVCLLAIIPLAISKNAPSCRLLTRDLGPSSDAAVAGGTRRAVT
jgi:hypothetical protein